MTTNIAKSISDLNLEGIQSRGFNWRTLLKPIEGPLRAIKRLGGKDPANRQNFSKEADRKAAMLEQLQESLAAREKSGTMAKILPRWLKGTGIPFLLGAADNQKPLTLDRVRELDPDADIEDLFWEWHNESRVTGEIFQSSIIGGAFSLLGMNFSNLPATLLSLLGTGMAFGLPAASRRAFQRQKVTTSGRTNPGPQELTAGGIADILGGFLIPTLTSMAANALGSRSPQEEALMKMMQQAGGQSPGEQGSENNIERHPAYAEQMASIRHGQGLTSQSFANVGESGSPDQFASEPALV